MTVELMVGVLGCFAAWAIYKRVPRPVVLAVVVLLLGVAAWQDGWTFGLLNWKPWASVVIAFAALVAWRRLRARYAKDAREARRLLRLETRLEDAEWKAYALGGNTFVSAAWRKVYLDERDLALAAARKGGLPQNRIEWARAHAIGSVRGESADRQAQLERDRARVAH